MYFKYNFIAAFWGLCRPILLKQYLKSISIMFNNVHG